LTGSQTFVPAVTVSELRYGTLVAASGQTRRDSLERAIATTTVGSDPRQPPDNGD
jgi:hypothetical protein